jgi:deoxyribodipyrimidine photo-lyase
VLPRVARAVDATAVHVSADYMPYGRDRDAGVENALAADDVDFVATGSPYAVAPGRVRKGDGTRFAVFTPYYNGWKAHGWRKPAEAGGAVPWINAGDLTGVGRRSSIESLAARVPDGMRLPDPGEQAAVQRWGNFLDGAVDAYADERNRPDRAGTSRMSPYLKWGCIHPRTMLADLAPRRSRGASAYRRELAWREFYADVVFHLPQSLRTSVDPVVDRMTWASGADAEKMLAAWRAGCTGFPYIDAGMRQLLAEGWMHNRVRMGVASFLIKDLHLPWQVGARHFLDYLVDGDVASNNHGWQWVAGSGPQAAAFYRIFNPVGQGEKFDPDGDYVRSFVPELRGVAGKAVHRPWDLPDGIPDGYPPPIVDHATERAAALSAWADRPRA